MAEEHDDQVAPPSGSAVFLDRAGVIGQKLPDGHYVESGRTFRFLAGLSAALSAKTR